MYSNYLTEVGKLVFLIGQIQTTSAFKKIIDTDHKSKYFFKCIDELPANSYNKIKTQTRRKGILKCDWFNKILDRSPMMIFMVFNFTQPLDKNEIWQDRLKIAQRKINDTVNILHSSNKEQTIVRIIIIISKEAVIQSKQPGNTFNINDKIMSILKIYERDIFIFQGDLITKQVNKHKNSWLSMLDKAYQRKYRAINKRKDDSFSERKMGCTLKMAILSQIINKKQSYQHYDEAYKNLYFRFLELIKGRHDPSNFEPIRQIRALADIIFLRMLIVKINYSSNYSSIPEIISKHLKFFSQKNMPHYFYEYQNLLWKQNFIQNLLEVAHINDHIQFIPKIYFCELVNGAVDLAYRLSCTDKILQNKLDNQEIKGRIIPSEDPVYIGCKNYILGVQITDIDIVQTEMEQLIHKRKDYITRGLQNISRYKAMKIFKENEVNYLNVYLMRFYIADQKVSSADTLSQMLAKNKLQKKDFYFLNGILNQIKKQPQRSLQQQIKISGIGVLLADYFNNKSQLIKYSDQFSRYCKNCAYTANKNVDLLQETNQEAQQISKLDKFFSLALPLPKKSDILNIDVILSKKLHPIQEKLSIDIKVKSNIRDSLIFLDGSCQLQLFFNHKSIKFSKQIKITQQINQIYLQLDPLQYFHKDQILYLSYATIKVKQYPFLTLIIQNINYTRFQSVTFFTKLQLPQISINMPYEIYYINEVSKFTIDIGHSDESIHIDAAFMVDEDQISDKTQIYTNYDDKMSLTNSKRSSPLKNTVSNVVYMKCNKLGHKKLKFIFNLVISQKIGDKSLMNTYKITRQIALQVNNLFKSLKIIKQSITGNEIKASQIPLNKRIILNYCLKSNQTINILQLGQHKSPKQSIKIHKDLKPIKNMVISPQEKLKNIVVFEVVEGLLNENQLKSQIFVISFYLKWSRIGMDMRLGISDEHNQCQNLYRQNQLKILLKSGQVQVQYEQGIVLKKSCKSTLSIKYRNLTNEQITVYSLMDNSEALLRIGSRSQTLNLGPRESKKMNFSVLPVKIGYQSYPHVRHFFDGIQAAEKQYKNYLCVL